MVTFNAHNFGICQDGNLGMIYGCFCNSFCAGKIIVPDQNGHMACEFGEEYTLFCRCKSSADYKDFFPVEEFSVTGCTVSYSMTAELCLTWKADHSWMGTCCKKDSKTLEDALVCSAFPEFCSRCSFFFFQRSNFP